MKTSNVIGLIVASGFAAISAKATPPTQVNDSFIVLNNYWPTGGLVSSAVLYLASDGSCELLSQSEWQGVLSSSYNFVPSSSGTYTYAQTPGDPNEATLSLSVPGLEGAANEALNFRSDTSGFEIGFGFSMFLRTSNTFLTNVSNRAILRSGETSTTGFVIAGTLARLVLVRAVGPSLATFGVSPVSGSPQFSLVSSSGAVLANGHNWSLVTNLNLTPNLPLLLIQTPPFSINFSPTQFDERAMNWIFSLAGAFPLKSGSNDQVFFGVLAPGAYTVQVSDSTVGASGGTALVEIYILPYSN